jgi:phage nucleotide-binding protein
MEAIDMSKTSRTTQPLRVVIYGAAGTGKTTLLKDFPKPLLLYDFDGKYEPLIGVDGIFVKSFRIDDRKNCLKTYLDAWKEWKADKKDTKWATIAWDSLTALDSIMFFACAQMSGFDTSNRANYEKYTLQIYGDVKMQYLTLFNSMRSCEKNVVVLAHESFNLTENGALESVTPLVTGGARDMLPAIFKDTWYLELRGEGDKAKRLLHTRRFKMRTATSVTVGNGEPIENPTYAKILEAYQKD